MAILRPDEAAGLLGYADADEMPSQVTSILIPAVDDFLRSATGKAWGELTDTYTSIDPTAKMAAGILLARWFENPEQVGGAGTSFGFGYDVGVASLIAQLEAKALQEKQAEATG